MKFRYTGREMTEVFGLQWGTGTEHDVTDEHAIKKLTHNHLFETVDGPAREPKKLADIPQEPVRPLPPALEQMLETPPQPRPVQPVINKRGPGRPPRQG